MDQFTWSKKYYPFLKAEVNRKRPHPLHDGMSDQAKELVEWVMIYLDSHPTHIFDKDVLLNAMESKILFVNYPGHHTHVLQPLDSGLFTGFKVRIN